jgi:hypothetical protein
MDAELLKRCARCKLEKPLSDFARKYETVRQPYCRACQAEYHREHYRKNKKRYVDAARERKRRLRATLREARNKPCADCGRQFPSYAMDLDHREGEVKKATFNELLYGSAQALLAEIAKCDVVCAVCHRIRTHHRKQWLAKRWRSAEREA